MNNLISRKLEELGVFPITAIHRIADVAPLADALIKADLPAVEVTFRTEKAEAAIRELSHQFPQMFLGAGTVLSPEQAQTAVDAGAQFVLTPGFNPQVVEYCLQNNIQIYPGVCTPSEIEQAVAMGLRELKFFPAEVLGGIRYLKAVTGPLSMVRFIPTGGINEENLTEYLHFDRILACAGSWIASPQLISEGKFELITERAGRAVQIVRAVRGRN